MGLLVAMTLTGGADCMELADVNKGKIDDIVVSIKWGEIIQFGDIGEMVWGKRNCGSVVGKYLFTQRGRENYPWWRVVNRDDHPVADAEAITRLESEGHKIRNGRIVK
jgi:Predicted methylated DNA-protein cysteine methyltransferase